MRKAVSLLALLAITACAGGSGGGLQSAPIMPAGPTTSSRSTDLKTPVSAAATTWYVRVGGVFDDTAVQNLDFFADTITIDAGDSVTYKVDGNFGGDAHTVAFVPKGMPIPSPLDPNDVVPAGPNSVDGTTFVNSGILVGGQSYTLAFPKAGTYRILCLFHEPAMESTVVVHAAGAPYPHTQQYYDQAGQADQAQGTAAAVQSLALFPFKNGGTHMAAGIDPGLVNPVPPDSGILRFIDDSAYSRLADSSGNITIKVGTVLTWTNETSNEPHTITFPMAGQHKVPNIPPDPPIIPRVNKSGVPVYDGTQIVNSGSLMGLAKFGLPQSFSLQFVTPGTYEYFCVYHYNSGMHGTITVVQ
ncbi:MAG TPA: plastocyanin/azurin family copper-binding protein [Candidatus Baltobacteraceae bacterium]|nr:plastocyanin/azurin family copper-binding protein [Candidatus Baltobacteraceae bacterium]